MWGLLEATKPEYRQYSPFWGVVALEGGMLKALRFYGNYTLSTDAQERQIDVASEEDPIAQLIQNLFPSPDGVSFLPNTKIRESGGFLSRHLESVNDIIGVLISAEADKKSKILDILRPHKEGKLVYGRGDDALSKVNAERFIDVLLKANNYTHDGHNIPYPQHATITILNAFFINVAEKVEDLEKLTVVMKPGFTAGKDLKPFTIEDYNSYYSQMDDILKNANQQPKLAFLLAYGKEHFNPQALTQPLLYYKSNVRVTLPNGKTDTFADCGETSIRNFFWKLSHLSPLALQTFFKNIEIDKSNIITHPPYLKMKEFALDEKLLGGDTQEAYDNWAQIVSGLNISSSLNFEDVAYSQSNFCEIEAVYYPNRKVLGGIYNWMNVMAKLIPDAILAESWDLTPSVKVRDQILLSKLHKKLKRLCTLASPHLSYSLTETAPYSTLIFSYQGEPYFNCAFSSYHYKCSLLRSNTTDWRKTYYNLSVENLWLRAFFNRVTDKSISPVSLSYVFNSSIFCEDKIYNTLGYVLHTNLEYLNPLLSQWVKKKNLLATNTNLEKLVNVLIPHLDKSPTRHLTEEFPILKGETIKALLNLKDTNTLTKSLFLFTGGNLKILKDNQEVYFSPLNFAYKLEDFNSIFTMLDLWDEDKIQIEYKDFKEIFVDLMSKSQINFNAQKRHKKRSKMQRQVKHNQKKLQECANKMIGHPGISKFNQEEKIDLVTAIIQTSCPVILFKNLMNSYDLSLTVEQKTDILRNNWKKSNLPLLSVLIEKGADAKSVQGMPTK